MTTTKTPTPSDVRNSSTMIPRSPTPISRMLYLRSDQADQSYGPTEKVWILPPMNTRGKHHNLAIRSLQIFHLFPNVPETVILNTGTKVVTIPAGNYSPGMIARYLNDQLYPEVTSVCYDPYMNIFRFCPGLNLVASTTTAQDILGFYHGIDYYQATESVLPVQLYGPTRIIVDSNLQLYNLPVSGRLGVFPVDKPYGQLISYDGTSATHSHLCMNTHLTHIHIRLTDEKGRALNGVDSIPWDLLISFEVIENEGFQNFIADW